MREQYTSPHKFDSPITAYIDEHQGDTLFNDEFVSNESDGGWAARIGKRIIEGDSNGFVSSTKCRSVAAAFVLFGMLSADPYFATEDDES